MENALLIGFGLIAAGFLLLIAEMFIPSHGVLSLAAAATAIAGVVVLFMSDQPAWGVIGMLVLVVLGPMAGGFMLKIWPDTALGRRLIHGEGGVDRDELKGQQQSQALHSLDALIGSEGKAVTDLRPAGLVEIGGKRYDALAETVAIDAGQAIKVASTGFGTLKVRPG